ncbi:MAG: hypothetical protein E6Z13_04295 [Dermabacter sp.]|nr:hypothetical protein [Dermabacter sp.]MDU5962355.1 hypothetical protein [Dermabacter sp.]
MTARKIFPDATVAVTFACVGRMDLLISWLRNRGAQCEGIEKELRDWECTFDSVAQLREALGTPIELTTDEELKALKVRVSVFGGTSAKPKQHLGEAMTLTLLERVDFAGATWVSDDRESREYASFQGIRSIDTVEILKETIADGDLSLDEGWSLWNEMHQHLKASCAAPTSKNDLLN